MPKVDTKALAEAAGVKAPGQAGGISGITKQVEQGINQAKQILKLIGEFKDLAGGFTGQAASQAADQPPPPQVIRETRAPAELTPKGGQVNQLDQILGVLTALKLDNVPLEAIWEYIKSQSVNELLGKSDGSKSGK